VRVVDACFDPGFEPDVDGRNDLDAYRHLFAYAAAEQTWQHERPDRHAGSLNRTGR
jgi:hypothetical protein